MLVAGEDAIWLFLTDISDIVQSWTVTSTVTHFIRTEILSRFDIYIMFRRL